MAREGDSNGHQASFQTERKAIVKRGGGGLESREVMKTIHPSPDVSDVRREKEFESLEAFPEVRQPLSKFQSVLIYLISSEFHFCFKEAESIYVDKTLLQYTTRLEKTFKRCKSDALSRLCVCSHAL